MLRKARYLLETVEKNFAMSPRPMIEFIKENHSKTDLVGVEIGTNEGVNAYYILSELPIKKLFLIDPYIKYDECGDFDVNDDWDPKLSLKKAKKRLARFGKKIDFIKQMSENASDLIPNDVDFIYIDSNHRYDFVKRDIELYFPKVRLGGVFGGHDFNANHIGVVRAVLEFVDKTGLKLHGKWTDWWIVKK